MTTFVLRLVHASDQCPTANAKVRERVLSMGANMNELVEKSGVKLVVPPLILGAEHESVAVVEADDVAQVNEFIYESGLIQWNSVRVSMAEPLPDALKHLEEIPPPLY
jgi:hypothetical protein